MPASRTHIRRAKGRAVRDRRHAAGKTQRQIADEIGTRPETISEFERGRREPTRTQLAAIARALGCSVDDLLPPEAE